MPSRRYGSHPCNGWVGHLAEGRQAQDQNKSKTAEDSENAESGHCNFLLRHKTAESGSRHSCTACVVRTVSQICEHATRLILRGKLRKGPRNRESVALTDVSLR